MIKHFFNLPRQRWLRFHESLISWAGDIWTADNSNETVGHEMTLSMSQFAQDSSAYDVWAMLILLLTVGHWQFSFWQLDHDSFWKFVQDSFINDIWAKAVQPLTVCLWQFSFWQKSLDSSASDSCNKTIQLLTVGLPLQCQRCQDNYADSLLWQFVFSQLDYDSLASHTWNKTVQPLTVGSEVRLSALSLGKLGCLI